MTRKRQTAIDLARFRLDKCVQGTVTQSDIQKFVPCGWQRAKKIFEQIMTETKADGKIPIASNRILTKRLLAKMGLTQSEIEHAYKKELELSAYLSRSGIANLENHYENRNV